MSGRCAGCRQWPMLVRNTGRRRRRSCSPLPIIRLRNLTASSSSPAPAIKLPGRSRRRRLNGCYPRQRAECLQIALASPKRAGQGVPPRFRRSGSTIWTIWSSTGEDDPFTGMTGRAGLRQRISRPCYSAADSVHAGLGADVPCAACRPRRD